MQPLESRILLTILSSYGAPNNTAIGEYLESIGTAVRVAVHDATVELIGCSVPSSSGVGFESDLVPDTVITPPTTIPNLYAIYVMQSSLDSYISIASVALPSSTETNDRPMLLSGSPTISVVDTGYPTSDTLITPALGAVDGALLLGNTSLATNETGLPIESIGFSVATVAGPYRPADFNSGTGTGTLYPGVYMSPIAINADGAAVDPTTQAAPTNGLVVPNDLGRFFFAGAITGNVDIPSPANDGITNIAPEPASQGGNVGVFYAGAILTGDSDGAYGEVADATASDNPYGPLPDGSNFYVGGDLRDLVTEGAIGGARGAAPRADVSQYLTNFRLVVAGTIGDIDARSAAAGAGVYGTVEAEHLSSVYGLPESLFTETELEAENQIVPDAATEQGDYFGPNDADEFADTVTGYPQIPSTIDTNNNVADQTAGADDITDEGSPQYLGSIQETDPDTGLPETDTHGNIVYEAVVDGILEGRAPTPESVDNYAVPLLAGQTIIPTLSIELLENEVEYGSIDSNEKNLTLSIIDPDGRDVASVSVSGVPEVGEQIPSAPFEYTAAIPGTYDFRITSNATTTDDAPYELTIEGVGNMGIGEVVASGGDIFDGGYDHAFAADSGDIGALIAPLGSSIAFDSTGSIDDGGDILEAEDIVVPDGSLRELKGGDLGVSTAESGYDVIPVNPLGNIAAFGCEPVLDVPVGQVGLLEALDAAGYLAVDTPFYNGVISNASLTTPTIPINGDIQTIDGLGAVFLDTATNAGMGTIDAGNMATIPSFIDVNADNAGNDGIIDLINVTGDLGTLANGGPGIVTHTGGYVKYMRVGGDLYQDAFFGGSFPTNTTFAEGQPASYTDDTGATLTFTPEGPVSVETYNNGLTSQSVTVGPQISLTTYGIRDKGGGVIVDATAIDGSMNITSSGGGSDNNEADISLIQFVGNSYYSLAASATTLQNGEAAITATLGTVPTVNGAPLANGTFAIPTGLDDETTGLPATGNITITGVTTSSSLLINGTGPVDVLDIDETGGTIPVPVLNTTTTTTSISTEFGVQEITATGNVDAIMNNTPGGEIDAISTVGAVREIYSRGTLGLVNATTPAAVMLANDPTTDETGVTGGTGANGVARSGTVGAFAQGNSFPFNLQTTGIQVGTPSAPEDALLIEAGGGLGNINVTGSIESIVADASGAATAGQFNGIDAPVAAGPLVEPTTFPLGAIGNTTFSTISNIVSVQIGQGVLPSGTGSFSAAGIYANGDIGLVTNGGIAEGDIRGNVVAEVKLGEISLNNASIIGAEIFAATPLVNSQVGGGLALNAIPPEITSNPQFELGTVSITGNGGILGSDFVGSDIRSITVGPQGFGIIGSSISSGGDGVIYTVTAGGYGIRDTTIIGGAVIGNISATGNGSQLPVTRFGYDVRQSEVGDFDQYSGEELTAGTDLDLALGTSSATPEIATATDTGVLQDDDIRDSTSLKSVSAETIRTIEPDVSISDTVGVLPVINIPEPAVAFPMEMNIAGSIGSIAVRKAIDGLQVTTGSLGSFSQSGSVSRLGISVAGTISSLLIRGNFGQTILSPLTGLPIPDSYIEATGAEGRIANLTIDGNLNGDITANTSIGTLNVRGSVVGNITTLGQTPGLALGTLRVGGTLTSGSLDIDGSAGTVITNGSLGAAGQSITVVGGLRTLEVGATARGSTLASAVHVEGPIGTLLVNGSITGALTVDGNVNSLVVKDNAAFPNAIAAPIIIGGRLGSATVIGGNVAADVAVNSSIGSFTIERGSLLYGATLGSTLGAIENFRITGGTAFGLYGALEEPDGVNGNVDISGNFGDGTDPAGIAAYSGNKFIIGGSYLADAAIDLAGPLSLLQVGGDTLAGASLTANPVRRVTVRGTNGAGFAAT